MCKVTYQNITALVAIGTLLLSLCSTDSQPERQGFHDSKVVRDAEHIQEHLDGFAQVNTTTMSNEELEFHYFKLHDFDNNTRLDGLEILNALTHMLPYEEASKLDLKGKTPDEVVEMKAKAKEDEMKYYTDIVDRVLEEDDLDNDGYLNYLEYRIARKRDEDEYEKEKAAEKKEKQGHSGR
ncbi:multiple coagulation factor deficiency protein 2 homolog isoform X2 [Lineus longissimus]